MPEYTITFARSARKELQSLPMDVAERLLKKIELLTINAAAACRKLEAQRRHRFVADSSR